MWTIRPQEMNLGLATAVPNTPEAKVHIVLYMKLNNKQQIQNAYIEQEKAFIEHGNNEAPQMLEFIRFKTLLIPMLTVSPQKLNLGTLVPNTPATTGPDAIPVCV